MTICSRTTGYCFPIVLLLFCNLNIPKQGIEMQILFLNGLWRFLKNGHLPVKLHSRAPPPPYYQYYETNVAVLNYCLKRASGRKISQAQMKGREK